MKHFGNDAASNGQLFSILLRPSWLSGFLSVSIAIAIAVLSIVSIHYRGSALQNQVIAIQDQQNASKSLEYTGIDNPEHGRLVEDIPLIFFWALLGLIVYLFAVNIVTALQNAKALHDSMDYVNAKPHAATREAAERFGLRVLVLAAWLPYIMFFFHHIIPFCVSGALAAGESLGVSNVAYGLEAVIVAVVALHVHTILFRLLLLKPRVFTSVIY